MAQFTQESFRFDLIWAQDGRLYAEPVQVYERQSAIDEHRAAAKFAWITPEMDMPQVSPLMAHWKDGSVQKIAPGFMREQRGLRSSESGDGASGGSSRPEGSSDAQGATESF